MHILVTGVAGFIGSHVAVQLLRQGYRVTGIDNLSSSTEPELKQARLDWIGREPNANDFSFIKLDLAQRDHVLELFSSRQFNRVIHLAAQAGVRHSIENPDIYIQANITGFLHILEGCRYSQIEHLVFASSSSVYGGSTRLPYSVHDGADHPYSLYAATKRSNELMAHSYAHLFAIPMTGLRFFTVYGPWGRPDMAPFMFTKAILSGEPISVFSGGAHSRDFTYIDDIVAGVIKVMEHVPKANLEWDPCHPDPASSRAPWRIYNIGNQHAVSLLDFIAALEKEIGCKAILDMQPAQPGDVADTWADVEELVSDVGFKPTTSIEEGLHAFVNWYRDYYRIDDYRLGSTASGLAIFSDG